MIIIWITFIYVDGKNSLLPKKHNLGSKVVVQCTWVILAKNTFFILSSTNYSTIILILRVWHLYLWPYLRFIHWYVQFLLILKYLMYFFFFSWLFWKYFKWLYCCQCTRYVLFQKTSRNSASALHVLASLFKGRS